MIAINFDKGKVVASIANVDHENFTTSVSILKNQKFRWNPDEGYWEKPAVLYSDLLEDTLKIVTQVYFPPLIKQQIKDYLKSLPTEITKGPPINALDYSKYSPFTPVVGKHPFENFQDEDIRKALQYNRFLFNWEMGLGKSFATSIIYEYLKVEKGVEKMILLTSRIGTYNLKSELAKFCKHLTEDDILVFNSPKSFKETGRNIFDSEEVNNKKVLIFSYDSWKMTTKTYGDTPRSKILRTPVKNFFKESEWLLCLDECHYLSNPKSDRSKSLFKYLKNFKYRYLFSATPADKNEKLYSIALLLDPKLVKYLRYDDWLTKYNDVGTFFSKYAINKNKWHQDELNELNGELSEFSAKRNAALCLDLPPYQEKTYLVEMSEKQHKLYKEVVNDIVNHLIQKNPDMASATVDVIKEAFGTVMSFTENPLVSAHSASESISDAVKEKCAKYKYSTDFGKLDVIDAIIEDETENNNRGILWYIHPLTKDVLIERYKNQKPIVISAEMTEDERFEAINEFKKNPEHKILIASQNILATSVTLIECTFAIYLETSFSYEQYLQSTGRIYRIGQTSSVRIYHVYFKNTIDMFHQEALLKKEDLVANLFSAKDKPNFSIKKMKEFFEGEL